MSTPQIFKITLLAALAIALSTTGCELTNNPPTISITVENYEPLTGDTQTFNAIVEDLDENAIVRVNWAVTGGKLANTTSKEVKWTAPLALGEVVVTAIADDGISNGIDSAHATLNVVNSAPEITSFEVAGFANKPPYVLMGGTIQLNCEANEPDRETITYSFNTLSGAGQFQQTDPEAGTADWTAPSATELSFSRIYTLYVEVSDEQGYSSSDTVEVLVYTEAGTIWVVDSEQAIVSKYTALGHYILTSSHSFEKPVAVAGDISRGYGCYVADYTAGQVVKLDPEGNQVDVEVFTNLPNVADLALHEATRTLWILSEGDSALVVYNTRSPVTPLKTVYGFKLPRAITINQSNNSVWISDVGDNSVIQLNALEALPDSVSDPGVTIFRDEGVNSIFNFPSGLGTRDQIDATVYIANRNENQIERLTYSSGTGTYSRNTPISIVHPSQVVSNVKGEVWVLNSEGNIQYFLESSINSDPFPVFSYAFSNPNSMAVDEVTGEIWIGDNGNHQVVKVLSPDSLAVVISGVDFIADIVVNR